MCGRTQGIENRSRGQRILGGGLLHARTGIATLERLHRTRHFGQAMPALATSL